jgi:hypothetical protein
LTGEQCPECGSAIALQVGQPDPAWAWRRLIASAWGVLVAVEGAYLVGAVVSLARYGVASGMPARYVLQSVISCVLHVVILTIGGWTLVGMWRARTMPRNRGVWGRMLRRFLRVSIALAAAKLGMYLWAVLLR